MNLELIRRGWHRQFPRVTLGMKGAAISLCLLLFVLASACKQTSGPESTSSSPKSHPPPRDRPRATAARPPREAAAGDDAPAPRTLPDYVLVPVYYATDRKPVMTVAAWQAQRAASQNEVMIYGAEWGPDLT